MAAARYPPLGIRGIAVVPRANDYGRIQGYHANAHLDTCVLVQLESKAALKEIEAIAAVEGVDGLFIGPSDLAGISVSLAILAILRCRPQSKMLRNASGQLENPRAPCPGMSTQSNVLSLWDSTSQLSAAMLVSSPALPKVSPHGSA